MAKTDTGEIAFQAQVIKALDDLPTRVKFPDGSNKGRLYGLLALWKKVRSVADNKYDALLKELTTNELITDPKTIKTAGTHTLGTAGKLEVVVDISQPRREFNLDWFAEELRKKYKVPPTVTRSLYEEAKKPGTTQSRTVKVTEQGVAI